MWRYYFIWEIEDIVCTVSLQKDYLFFGPSAVSFLQVASDWSCAYKLQEFYEHIYETLGVTQKSFREWGPYSCSSGLDRYVLAKFEVPPKAQDLRVVVGA